MESVRVSCTCTAPESIKTHIAVKIPRMQTPLLGQGGVAATSSECREASFDGADGVVCSTEFLRLGRSIRSPAAKLLSEASRLFVDVAASPPWPRRGVSTPEFHDQWNSSVIGVPSY